MEALAHVKQKSKQWKNKFSPREHHLTISSFSPSRDNFFIKALIKAVIDFCLEGKRLSLSFSQQADADQLKETSRYYKSSKVSRVSFRVLEKREKQLYYVCQINHVVWKHKRNIFKTKINKKFGNECWKILRDKVIQLEKTNNNKNKKFFTDQFLLFLERSPPCFQPYHLPRGNLVLGQHPETKQYGLFHIAEEMIGHGSFSRVHKTYDLLTNAQYIFKSSRPDRPKNNQFLNKEDTLLKHVHAMKLCHGIQEPFKRAVRFKNPTMEERYTDGYLAPLYSCNGEQYLNNRQEKTQLEIMGVIYQLIKGIVQLHEKEIAHGDIKPANILIRKTDTSVIAHIADFHGAWHPSIVDHNKRYPTLFYTPAYCVDTQLQQLKKHVKEGDYASAHTLIKGIDLFGIGLVFFQLQTDLQPLPFYSNSFTHPKDFERINSFSQWVKNRRSTEEYPVCRDPEMAVLMNQFFSYDDPAQWTVAQIQEAFVRIVERHFPGWCVSFEQMLASI